jgi:ADP-glucose pyrophosphorylase
MKQSFFIDSTDGMLKWIQNIPEEPDFKKLKHDPVYQEYLFYTGYTDSDVLKQHKEAIELTKKEAVVVEEPYIYQLLMHRYYPEFLDYSKTPYDNFLIVADKSRIYTIDMEEEIEVVRQKEREGKWVNIEREGMDDEEYKVMTVEGNSRLVARIKPKKVEESEDDLVYSSVLIRCKLMIGSVSECTEELKRLYEIKRKA